MKIGDVVRLKEGGPKMTVEGRRDSKVACVWFDKRPDGTWGGLHRCEFEAAELMFDGAS